MKLKIIGHSATFWCPGCSLPHSINIGAQATPSWGFNGDIEKPTFTPSVLVTSGHYASGHKSGSDCWCTYYEQHPEEEKDGFECGICHSFVTDGQIQFLSDCSHALAGQTVAVPDYPMTKQGGE